MNNYLVSIQGSSICLKGEKMISSLKIGIPKCLPSLAEKKNTIVTPTMDKKSPIHPGGSNSFNRFQVAGILAGYRENQYTGRYTNAGAQIATFPREWKQP